MPIYRRIAPFLKFPPSPIRRGRDVRQSLTGWVRSGSGAEPRLSNNKIRRIPYPLRIPNDAWRITQYTMFNQNKNTEIAEEAHQNAEAAQLTQSATLSRINELSTRKASMGEVWRLAFPIIISMASMSLLGLVDTLFMRWVGPEAQAAVGIGSPSVFSICSIFLGMISGLTTFVSQYYGAKRMSECGRILWHVLFMAGIFGILSAFCLSPLVYWLLQLMGTNPDIFDGVYGYMNIRIYACPWTFISYALLSFLRGIGDMKTPALVSFFVVLINIPLTYIFTFGLGPIPAYGIQGAAIGTIIAQAFEMLMYLFTVIGKKNAELFSTRLFPKISWSVIKSFTLVSLPIGLSWAMEQFGWLIYGFYIGSLPKEQSAANAIVQVFMNIAWMPGLAISIAATTLVGQYLGAKNIASAEQSAKYSMYMSVACLVSLGILFFLCRFPIAYAFSDNTEVIQITANLFYFLVVYQVLDALGVTTAGALRGAGDTKYPMIIMLICIWGLMVPCVFIVDAFTDWQIYGAWAVSSLTVMLMGLLFFLRFRQGKWKSMTVK